MLSFMFIYVYYVHIFICLLLLDFSTAPLAILPLANDVIPKPQVILLCLNDLTLRIYTTRVLSFSNM